MASKPIVAILLRDEELSRALREELAASNLEPRVLPSSDELHTLVHSSRVDGIVIDYFWPGFLNGLEILERLTGDLIRPNMVLVGTLSLQERERAGRCGVAMTLPPGSSTTDIAEAVLAGVEAGPRTRDPLPVQARRLVEHIEFVGPLPQLLAKLPGYLDDKDASLKDLARDVSADARSTAELLKLTNSAACGLGRKVASVQDAVSILGIRWTVSLILSAAIMSTQKVLLKPLPREFSDWFQRRSVLISSVASIFAKALEGVSPETAQVLGLLQDLGILVLANAYGEKYTGPMSRVNALGKVGLDEAERQAFGFTHADVSAALLMKWGLPQAFVQMAMTHHAANDAGDCPDVELRFRRTMQIGERVAGCMDSESELRHESLITLFGYYGPDQLEKCMDALRDALTKSEELASLFSVPAPDGVQLQELLVEIRQKLDEARVEAASA